MTNEQRASATDAGLPALQKHCGEVQTTAVHLSGVLQAIETLDHDNLASNAVTTLIGIALAMAEKISIDLDSVNLPGDRA